MVVGEASTEAGWEAFRWEDGNMVGLGHLPGASSISIAYDVSADGSVIGGYSKSSNGYEAFRWEDGNMIGLGDFPEGSFSSVVLAVSADGSILAGHGAPRNAWEACLWEGGNMISLGRLPGGTGVLDAAQGISADGSIITGQASSAEGYQAFRWEGGSMVGLGDLPGGRLYSRARDISADGSVIVGQGTAAEGMEAFRWEGGSMIGLGDLSDGNYRSHARGVSADGSVIVGDSDSGSGAEAFIWDDVNGMRSLRDVLTGDYGLDLTGWTLQDASAVSDDGTVVVGYGRNPGGVVEAWIARLGPIDPALGAFIDIKPGSDINPVNLKSRGVLPVAIYGSEEFDVSQIDMDSLALEGVGPRVKGASGRVGSLVDINGDSILDLMLHFDMDELTIDPDAEALTLTGLLLDGSEFEGADNIRIVPLGDADGSGKVDGDDLSLLLANWGSGTRWEQGNFNSDDTVNEDDLSLLLANWNQGTPSMDGEIIPEPATLGLLVLGGLALIRRRRR